MCSSVFGIVMLVTLGFAFKSGSEMLMGEDDGPCRGSCTALTLADPEDADACVGWGLIACRVLRHLSALGAGPRLVSWLTTYSVAEICFGAAAIYAAFGAPRSLELTDACSCCLRLSGALALKALLSLPLPACGCG